MSDSPRVVGSILRRAYYRSLAEIIQEATYSSMQILTTEGTGKKGKKGLALFVKKGHLVDGNQIVAHYTRRLRFFKDISRVPKHLLPYAVHVKAVDAVKLGKEDMDYCVTPRSVRRPSRAHAHGHLAIYANHSKSLKTRNAELKSKVIMVNEKFVLDIYIITTTAIDARAGPVEILVGYGEEYGKFIDIIVAANLLKPAKIVVSRNMRSFFTCSFCNDSFATSEKFNHNHKVGVKGKGK